MRHLLKVLHNELKPKTTSLQNGLFYIEKSNNEKLANSKKKAAIARVFCYYLTSKLHKNNSSFQDIY